MNHLSPSELVEWLEGTLAARRAEHVNACETCQASVTELQEITQRVSASEGAVPEPSPLFWDHLSTRIREAVAAEQVGRTPWWLAAARPFAPVAAAVILLVLVSATVVIRRSAPPASVEPAREVTHVEPGMDVDVTVDSENREVWEVLTAAAADLELEEAHAAGLSVQPSAIDRAVQRLTADELNELGRLLQSELKRSSN
jgi:hypothetical protein